MNNRILIAEDDPTNMKILKLTLEEGEYQIESAINGKTAWEILEKSEEPFDVIILDWMMPEMDGMEMLVKIKQDKRFQHIPVIIQTAKARQDDIAMGLEKGAFHFLTKPFEEEVFISIVKLAIEENKNTRR